MRACVYGAGAIGGHLAARLANAPGVRLSVVARGTHLQAMRTNGVSLVSNGETIVGRPYQLTDDPGSLPPQDVIFTTVKATALPGIAGDLARLVAANGSIAFACNGVPWWWHHGRRDDGVLPLLDPHGELWDRLRFHAIGTTVLSANQVTAPGAITHAGPNDWTLGEPSGADTGRLSRIVSLLASVGVRAEASGNIRQAIWNKLLLNASFNPLGALTLLFGSEISADLELKALAERLLRETMGVGEALGLRCDDVDVEHIVSGRGRAPARPSSMFQDVLAGRRLEVDAILGQVVEFAREHQVDTPTLRLCATILRGRDLAILRDRGATSA